MTRAHIVSNLTNEDISVSIEDENNLNYYPPSDIELSTEINRINKELVHVKSKNLVKIYTGLKIISIGNFSSYKDDIECDFEIFFKYNLLDFKNNNLELNTDNSFDISVLNSTVDCTKIVKALIDTTNNEVRLLYRISSVLKITNNSSYSPFNILIVPFNIHIENIYIKKKCDLKIEELNYKDFFINNFKYIELIKGHYSVNSDLKLYDIEGSTEKRDIRINYAFYTPNSTWFENMIKYLFLPILLTNFLLIFANIDDGEYSNLFATLVLADIALLFTIPETGNTNISEICINMNMILKIIIGLLRIKIFQFNQISLTDLYAATIVLVLGIGTFGRAIADYTDVSIPSSDPIKQSLNQTRYFYTEGRDFGNAIFGFDILGDSYARFDDAVKSSVLTEWYMYFSLNLFLIIFMLYFVYKSYKKYIDIRDYFKENFKPFNIRKETLYRHIEIN